MSMCRIGTLPSYSRRRTNDGLVTRSVTPRADAAPCTKHVLPAPNSPVNATTSPGRNALATVAATWRVSCGVRETSTSSADTPTTSSVPRLLVLRQSLCAQKPWVPGLGNPGDQKDNQQNQNHYDQNASDISRHGGPLCV